MMASSPTYPDLPQCEGTIKREITNRVIDRSVSGLIKARVFYTHPLYEITIVHTSIDKAQYKIFNAWYRENFDNEVVLHFKPEDILIKGVISQSPSVEYEDWERYTVTVGIQGREVI